MKSVSFAMYMLIPLLILIVSVLTVVACGKTVTSEVVVPVERTPAVVFFFTEWDCPECAVKLIELNQHISTLSPAAQKSLRLSVFLMTGKVTGSAPTQQDAYDYAERYAPEALAYADVNRVNYRNVMVGLPTKSHAVAIYNSGTGSSEPVARYLDVSPKTVFETVKGLVGP